MSKITWILSVDSLLPHYPQFCDSHPQAQKASRGSSVRHCPTILQHPIIQHSTHPPGIISQLQTLPRWHRILRSERQPILPHMEQPRHKSPRRCYHWQCNATFLLDRCGDFRSRQEVHSTFILLRTYLRKPSVWEERLFVCSARDQHGPDKIFRTGSENNASHKQ